MAFTVDYLEDAVYVWTATADGAEYERIEDYRPTLYATAEDGRSLEDLECDLERHPAVAATASERRRPGFRRGDEPVLRVDVATIDDVRSVAQYVRQRGRAGTYRCFNVDLSREFRYCLETDTDPTPAATLSTLELDADALAVASPPLTELEIDGDPVSGSPTAVLEAVRRRLERVDPDVLVLSSSRLVPLLDESAREHGVDLGLGRLPGYQRLAGRSTSESYGAGAHSPARYNVPGRVVIDRSNTFFYRQSGLAGCLDLVSRSRKPLQELAWASIGNVLTAIQIREARERGVLVPWHSWRGEFFAPMATLHDADRGGYTFSPEVGLHEDVHELDFSSLYPNIICTHNISPETIRCECHADRSDVPGLGYAICERPGYLPEVLEPLIEDRDAIKAELARTNDEERAAALGRRSSAIKWILVSCFGYQGFSNAKFGRIECHEAINAYARDILLRTKELLERNGWRLLHGIVDSVWVTPAVDESQEPLSELAAAISAEVGIRLEYESAFEWVAFVPLADSEEGALTKYVGKRRGGDYKIRGLETRRRDTPEWVASLQRECLRLLDDYRSPEAICAHLQGALQRLRADEVEPTALAITSRASKPRESYRRYTRTVAALERATDLGLDPQPGQDLSYVVVDDDARARDRVRLACEEPDRYDPEFYAERAIDAVETVCAPLGWRRAEIDRYLSDRVDGTLTSYR